MVNTKIVIIFATKLMTKCKINKFSMNISATVDPRVYYQNLRKKDKTKLLKFLSQEFDYSPSTMSQKLRGNTHLMLRKDEYVIIQQTIEQGLWKK